MHHLWTKYSTEISAQLCRCDKLMICAAIVIKQLTIRRLLNIQGRLISYHKACIQTSIKYFLALVKIFFVYLWVSFVEWKHTNNCCKIIIFNNCPSQPHLGSTRHPGRWAPHNASNIIVQLNSDSDRDTEFILSLFCQKNGEKCY